MPVSRTGDNGIQNGDQYEHVGGVCTKGNTVDRCRRQSHIGASLHRRSVADMDRCRRPVSYQDFGTSQPANSVGQNVSRYQNNDADCVESMLSGSLLTLYTCVFFQPYSCLRGDYIL